MQSIDDLINALSDTSVSLTSSLLRAQVLAHQLGDQELLGWVKGELSGYRDDSPLPAYRARRGITQGTISDGFRTLSDCTLSTAKMDEQQRAYFLSPIRSGIGELEHQARREIEGKEFAVPVDPVWFPLLDYGLNEDFSVQQAWLRSPAGFFGQIVTEVRSRLLDFALQLRDKVPADAAPSTLKDAIAMPDLRNMFHSAMGNTITLVINAGNAGDVSTAILLKNNLAALKSELSKHGIDSDQLEDLGYAIEEDSDEPQHGDKKLGRSVLAWLGDVTKSSLKSGTEVAIKAALEHFYGR
ncbi:hypothetical protein DyAD56_16145 [Dyella sp. AD56]|uniref:AbiTii domain-containing protein n=1 Tax=Dyella sp. AD56 TaxID=1528744 RepID=UPI000C83DCA2|nr:hypothetical protein [Dyella sp. AD56]PMQ04220.1 hypothetical protein DyAD56_16145 [Dyella sp. AD56]